MDEESKKSIDTFYKSYPLKKLDKDEVVIQPETELTSVFYLVEGVVSQYDISSSGNDIIVNVFKPGAFFPMSTAINHTPNYYVFEALTPVSLRVAPAEKVVEFVKGNPEVLFDLLSRVYRGTDGLLRRMAHLMGGSARTRVIFELINATYRFGVRQANGAMLTPLTENDIAKRSGLSRETVSRMIRGLKDNGHVQVQSTGLLILDIDALQELLGTDI